MGFQYQAPTNREMYSWHFRVPAPKNIGSEIVEPGSNAVFIRRHYDSEHGDTQMPKRQALLGRFGLTTPHWATPEGEEIKYSALARTDKVAGNKIFGKLWESGQHCIVPIESFNKTYSKSKWPEKTRISGAKNEMLGAPPRHNSCRLNRTKNLGGGDEGLQWHDTDKHSRTGR